MTVTDMSSLDPELRKFLDTALDRIRKYFRPEAMIFFGSRATGTPDEWSDIDLVIVSDRFHGEHPLRRPATFRRIARPHRRVDALCLTPEEFADRAGRPTIIREAFRTGIRVI